MGCFYCRDFQACYPGQPVPPHDCLHARTREDTVQLPIERLEALVVSDRDRELLARGLCALVADVETSQDDVVDAVILHEHIADGLDGYYQ